MKALITQPLLMIALCAACGNDRLPPLTMMPAVDAGRSVITEMSVLHASGLTPEQPFTVTIPEGVLGFQLVAIVHPRPNERGVGVSRIVTPDGRVVLDDFAPTPMSPQTSLGIEAGSAVVPQAQELATGDALPAGDWVITPSLNGALFEGERLDLDVYLQKGTRGAFDHGVINLELYVPEGLLVGNTTMRDAVSAETAADHPYVQAFVRRFYTVLRSVFGLDRGTVSFRPLPESFLEITSAEEFDAAASATDDNVQSVVRIVLTNWLDVNGSDGAALAMTAGIPTVGPQGATPQSAIVTQLATGLTATTEGGVLVHELGHFVGLFHTSELDGMTVDPYDDTPECTNILESPASCPDRLNVMFPFSTDMITPHASFMQNAVMHGSPIYQPYFPSDIAATSSALSIDEILDDDAPMPAFLEDDAVRELVATMCGNSPRGVLDTVHTSSAELTRIASDETLPRIVRVRADNVLRWRGRFHSDLF